MGTSWEELCREVTATKQGTPNLSPSGSDTSTQDSSLAIHNYLVKAARCAFIARMNVSNDIRSLRLAGNRAAEIILPADLNGRDLHCHLRSVADAIKQCLGVDDSSLGNIRVSTAEVYSITALVAALAAASAPDLQFDELVPVWRCMIENDGKALASFLMSFSSIINHTREFYKSYYADLVLGQVFRLVLIRSEQSAATTVLRVIGQCFQVVGSDMEWLLPAFIRFTWGKTMSLQRGQYKQLVELTVVVAKRTGLSALLDVVSQKVYGVPEAYLRMVAEIVRTALGGSGDDAARMEELLLDMDRLFISSF